MFGFGLLKEAPTRQKTLLPDTSCGFVRCPNFVSRRTLETPKKRGKCQRASKMFKQQRRVRGSIALPKKIERITKAPNRFTCPNVNVRPSLHGDLHNQVTATRPPTHADGRGGPKTSPPPARTSQRPARRASLVSRARVEMIRPETRHDRKLGPAPRRGCAH